MLQSHTHTHTYIFLPFLSKFWSSSSSSAPAISLLAVCRRAAFGVPQEQPSGRPVLWGCWQLPVPLPAMIRQTVAGSWVGMNPGDAGLVVGVGVGCGVARCRLSRAPRRRWSRGRVLAPVQGHPEEPGRAVMLRLPRQLLCSPAAAGGEGPSGTGTTTTLPCAGRRWRGPGGLCRPRCVGGSRQGEP